MFVKKGPGPSWKTWLTLGHLLSLPIIISSILISMQCWIVILFPPLNCVIRGDLYPAQNSISRCHIISPSAILNCCGRKYLAILCPFCQIENWREFYKAQPVCDSIHHSGQFWVILKYQTQTLITFKWSKANEFDELKEILCCGKRHITTCDASTLPKLPLYGNTSWKSDAKHISVTMCFMPCQKKTQNHLMSQKCVLCFDALRVCVIVMENIMLFVFQASTKLVVFLLNTRLSYLWRHMLQQLQLIMTAYIVFGKRKLKTI